MVESESGGELLHCFCYSNVSIKKAHPSSFFKMTFTPSYPKVPCLLLCALAVTHLSLLRYCREVKLTAFFLFTKGENRRQVEID